MANLLGQLENNEAVLLMYLAGELPAEDQAEVEQMLTTDAQLAGELQRLRATVADHAAFLESADTRLRLPVTEAVAVRNTLRRMRQWRLEHPWRPAAPAAKPGLAYPWWAYPSASAAMLLLAALVWWGFREEPVGPLVLNGGRGGDVSSRYVAPVDPGTEPNSQAFAYADPLDQAYLELRSIQELADGF
jgi:hypothetical protein